MVEQYEVTLQSQMGPREGILTLRYKGSYVAGSLELMGYVNAIQGVESEDGTLHLFHPIKTVISTFPCETVLERHSESLSGTTTAEPCRMHWKGTLLHRDP